jgi:O-antigen/teichoic acid export membrane protein
MVGVYNIVANLVLIPIFGIGGAIFASGTAGLLKNLFIWWFVRDLARWKHAIPFLLRSTAVWSTYVLIATFVGKSLAERPAAVLLIGLALWLPFCLLYFRSGVLNAEHKGLIKKLFSGSEQRWLRILGVV